MLLKLSIRSGSVPSWCDLYYTIPHVVVCIFSSVEVELTIATHFVCLHKHFHYTELLIR